MHFFNASEGLIIGQSKVYATSNGGTSWALVNIATSATLRSLRFGSDVNSAWVVGDDIVTSREYIYKLDRIAGVWTPTLQYTASGSVIGALNDVWPVSNSIGWAAGTPQNTFKTSDGVNWSVIDLTAYSPAATFTSIYAYDAYNCFLVSNGGHIVFSNDGGSNWVNENSGTTQSLNDVYLATNTIGYIVGNGGTILRKTNIVLPVRFSSFTAQTQNKKVLLNWQTSSELNNKGFALMRKPTTGSDWQQVGYISSKGNSNQIKSYSFTDEPKGGAEFLYQLKQTDIDGKVTLSNILQIKLDISDNSFSNYPNPFNSSTTFNYSLKKVSDVKIIIGNQAGQIVKSLINKTQAQGNYAISLQNNDLPAGVYYAEFISNGQKMTRKIIVIK